MLIRNNPNIDFDALEQDIHARVATYRQALQQHELPVYDPARLQKARLDIDVINVDGGLDELYTLEDTGFVKYAYPLLVGRPPTEREIAACTHRLRAGENKTRIACELRYCDEGKTYNSAISLKKELIAYKLISLPLIGRLVDICSIALNLPALKTISQAKENHQYRILKLLETDMDQKSRRLSELGSKTHEQARQLGVLQAELKQALGAVDEMSRALASSRARLNMLEQKQTAPGPAGAPVAAAAAAPTVGTSTSSDEALYVAFEEKYRGSASAIRERLGYYLPQIKGVLRGDAAPASQKIVDVGCGRGEWLSLLREQDFEAIGIDTNVHNINSCKEAGLHALHEDALQWLAEQPDASLGCISAFHVIEHLEFGQLSHFLDNALRCLCPGGLLLLETPNPENVLIASNAFYLDPTHIRPLPPGLMEFLLSYKGFAEVSVDRMHPVDAELMIHEDTEVARRCNLFFYEAQDYAVAGIRPR